MVLGMFPLECSLIPLLGHLCTTQDLQEFLDRVQGEILGTIILRSPERHQEWLFDDLPTEFRVLHELFPKPWSALQSHFESTPGIQSSQFTETVTAGRLDLWGFIRTQVQQCCHELLHEITCLALQRFLTL